MFIGLSQQQKTTNEQTRRNRPQMYIELIQVDPKYNPHSIPNQSRYNKHRPKNRSKVDPGILYKKKILFLYKKKIFPLYKKIEKRKLGQAKAASWLVNAMVK